MQWAGCWTTKVVIKYNKVENLQWDSQKIKKKRNVKYCSDSCDHCIEKDEGLIFCLFTDNLDAKNKTNI